MLCFREQKEKQEKPSYLKCFAYENKKENTKELSYLNGFSFENKKKTGMSCATQNVLLWKKGKIGELF